MKIKHRYKFILLPLIICLLVGCNRKMMNVGGASNRVMQIVNRIEKGNEIHTEAIGPEGRKSKLYDSFLKLASMASIEELLVLTRHSSPAVRGYSFWALARKEYEALDEVIIQHANDEKTIYFFQGSNGEDYPLIDIMSMIVSPNKVDLECGKLTKNEFARLDKYRKLVKLISKDDGMMNWSEKKLETGQRKIIKMDFSDEGACATRPCQKYGDNKATFDFLKRIIETYPDIEIGLGVFSSDGGNFAHNKVSTQVKAEGIKQELEALGIKNGGIITLGFGSIEMNPNYKPIQKVSEQRYWVELVIIEKKPRKMNITLVEFDKHLSKIDFKDGVNIEKLEDYLLACLAQLEKFKDKEPSYELFLTMFDQARNGPKVDFDLAWKEQYAPEKDWIESEWDNLTEWERVVHELRSLATDLIHTRAVRNEDKKILYEWNTEGGIRFYNGTTPSSILGYAATRFEGEYPPTAFQYRKVTWEAFTAPLWIGISYE